MQKLPRTFYDRDTRLVARELLGKYLVRRADGVERIGKIVEVEAYLGAQDLACHASKGRTPRTEVMFGPPGYAYVYFIYGMHHCMNVVTERPGIGAAVLIRALEPVKNIFAKTNGPGLLCKAIGIDRRLDGQDLLSPEFFIAAPESSEGIRIVRRSRVGVNYAGAWARRLLRFYIQGSGFISKP